jgi:hypothetical protein
MLLTSIIAINNHVNFPMMSINVSVLIYLICGSRLIINQTIGKTCYQFILVVIVMMTYVSLLTLRLYDPVWIFVDVKLLIPTTLTILLLVICRNQTMILASLLIGIPIGDIIYRLLLFDIGFNIGTNATFTLDILAVAVVFSFVFTTILGFFQEAQLQRIQVKTIKKGRAFL